MSYRSLTLLCLGGIASAQGAVLTVDDDGPAAFSDLDSAIAAALDGDVLLIEDGSYCFTQITGKSLTIQSAGTPGGVQIGGVFFFQSARIGPLTAGEGVTLRGVTLIGGFDQASVVVQQANGPVVFEDCVFDQSCGNACEVEDSRSVTFKSCELDAGINPTQGVAYEPRSGLEARDSSVFLYDTNVRGAYGGDAFIDIFTGPHPAGQGGVGIGLFDSQLFTFGSTSRGGDGGSVRGLANCLPGGNGGAGLVLLGNSSVQAQDSTFNGGTGGAATGGSCPEPDGDDGLGFSGPAASLTILPGSARSLSIDSPATEGTSALLSFRGEPGDDVVLYYAVAVRNGRFFPGVGAALHLATPIFSSRPGTIPAGGLLQTSQSLPLLAPGRDSAVFIAQAVFFSTAGALFHAGPSKTVILDASF